MFSVLFKDNIYSSIAKFILYGFYMKNSEVKVFDYCVADKHSVPYIGIAISIAMCNTHRQAKFVFYIVI